MKKKTKGKREKRTYLDFASGSPLDPKVKGVMVRALGRYGNPSSLHKEGQQAKRAISDARKRVAELLHAHPDEIIFTSGGTEGDNLAITGAVRAFRENYPDAKFRPHIVTSAIEHAAVRETIRALAKDGADVTEIVPDEKGIVSATAVRAALRPQTILVSVMHANNEIGTIQPIAEIAKEIRHFRKTRNAQRGTKNTLKSDATRYALHATQYPLFHTDAAQAMNYLPIDMRKLDVNMLSFNGSKIYGPHGAGILYRRRGTPVGGILFGGNQEFHLRPGTENTPAIVGLQIALETALSLREKESKRLMALRDYCISKIKKMFPDARINGDEKNRLPNNVNVSFPNISSELLVIELDAKGIAVSSKSACKSDDPDESYVLSALYGKENENEETGSIRASFGRETIKKDIDRLLQTLEDIFQKMKPWRQ